MSGAWHAAGCSAKWETVRGMLQRRLTSAQQKRERNAKGTGKEAKSQLKSNEAAKNIVCQVCRQTFLMTVREPAYVTIVAHIKSLPAC